MNAKSILGVVVAALIAGQTWAVRAHDEPLIVFAASSLAGPLKEIAKAYTAETGRQVRLSYASSAVLARQIERGAPAGLFISAHPDWLTHLVATGAIAKEDIVAIAGNRLALASASDDPDGSGLVLLRDLNERQRLAVGAPDTVPLGIYTREALSNLGLWQTVEGKLAEAASARAAVALVQSGAARYGVLYASDIRSAGLIALAHIPAVSHSPILYRAAPIRAREATEPSSSATAFLDFLQSATARTIFEDKGFILPPAPQR